MRTNEHMYRQPKVKVGQIWRRLFLPLFALALLAPNALSPRMAHAEDRVLLLGDLWSASGLAVDSAGNIFIGDFQRNAVRKATPNGGSYVLTSLANHTNGLRGPSGVAVDRAGNVFFADTVNDRVAKLAPTGGSYQLSVVLSGIRYVQGVAVDSAGNLFITDDANDRVIKATPDGSGGYIQSVAVSGVGFPVDVAVDGAGNLFIIDRDSHSVIKAAPTRDGSYTLSVVASDLSFPEKVAVDSAGNVFFSEYLGYRILKATPAGNRYSVSLVIDGVSHVTGVTVDRNGTLYFLDDRGLSAIARAGAPHPSRTINDTDGGITYSGGWGYHSGRGIGDYRDDVHATTRNGDSFGYLFKGTGIAFITEFSADEGEADIYIDGKFQGTVNCSSDVYNVPRQVAYSITGLAAGSHTLKVVKRSGTWMLLDALTIW